MGRISIRNGQNLLNGLISEQYIFAKNEKFLITKTSFKQTKIS